MRTKLCDSILRQSTWVWNQLKQGRGVKYQLQEETLTDLLVLNLKRKHPRQILTQTFTKPVENVLGADWQWWLTGPSGKWLGCRVQAKVLNQKSRRFEELHYQPRAAKGRPPRPFQSDTLVNRAKAAGLIPLYCLYSHGLANEYRPTGYTECYAKRGHVSRFGCSLVFAPFVQALRGAGGPTNNWLSAVLIYMHPWHSFFCCSNGQSTFGGDLPHRAYSWYTDTVNRSIKLGYLDASGAAEVRLLDNPPPYVRSLLDEGSTSEPPDEYLRRLTIFIEMEEG